jgi:two-component system alkaline phosphatase synthesis response regulator PhoP
MKMVIRNYKAIFMSRILIVEDEDEIRKIWELALQPLGHEIISAANGLEALYQARNFEPDLVVLDLMMPTASGDLVLGFIRSTDQLKKTLVLVVSAHQNVASLAEQYEADAYLAKPVQLADLRKMVIDLMDSRS